MLLSERVYAVVPSSASFLGVMCIQNVVVIRDRLKEDYNFKCQTCANHEKCRAKDCFLSGFSFRNIQKSQSSRKGDSRSFYLLSTFSICFPNTEKFSWVITPLPIASDRI